MSERQLHIPARFRRIVKEPNWYDQLTRLQGSLLLGGAALGNVAALANETGNVKSRTKRLLVRIFEQLLEEGSVRLGETGPNWDEERRPIDRAVIHHTSNLRPMRLSYLNALHLLNLYVPKYRHPGPEADVIGGRPVYSGHERGGNQVFYGYHWLVRQNGTVESLLRDTAIGWHAGNWEVNCRSVAICFDADLQNDQPTEAALQKPIALAASLGPGGATSFGSSSLRRKRESRRPASFVAGLRLFKFRERLQYWRLGR